MIPLLYEKDGISKIGELSNCIECLVEEERNGLFELTIVYPTTDSIFNSLEEENIIICNANDTLKSQKFRIYMTKKLMSNRVEVYARHISFDLAYDRVESINITNQSCEYSLNAIFKQSQFSTNYRGYSDIINAQNYTIANVNCIEAIAGKEGSIIDTYGTGAEILRDNTNIHVLNRRGNDNEVTIEYAKNLTGFELEEDFSELVTRINASAKYTDTETNKVVIVEAKGIDSPLISNYSHPYISHFDYSDKFEEGEKPTSEKLITLAKKEYSINNKDKPKQNFKIEFIPLSKCVGYEDLEDKISLCDTVTIIDTRYGVNTKAKVIRVVFNVLKDRYESMELGEPRTTLGDIIGTGSNTSNIEDLPTAGPQGPPGQDGTNGVDGVDAIYVNLTNDSHIVPTLSDGTGGNYTGCATTIELYKGADKLNYGVTYEAEQIEGITASLKDNVYSISNMTVDSCNVGLRATYNGKTYLKYFNVSKSKKGVDGTDGVTYYTWIRYADDGKGNGISNDPTGKEYIGFAYNKTTPIESNVPGDYTWSLIKGTDGVPGQNGADGTTYYTWIKYSDNSNGNPCYDIPTPNTQYIGIATNKTSPKESDDPGAYVWSKFKGDDGVNGADGITYYTWIKYADDLQGNGISNDPLNKDCIGFAYNKTTSIESDNPKDYSWSLIKGAEGVPGEPGEDGKTYYTWIKYSDFENGNPCYDTPTSNTKYIGIATNKLTSTESNDPNDYKWSKFRGDDGVDGTNGVDGTDGKDGYTINISNDSHVFAAESDGKILKQQYTTTKIVAFKGVDTVPFTIEELPLIPGLGLAKDSTTVSITAFVGYDLEENGSFEIPIIIEGLTFKKVFSWSKAKKGVDGSLGDFPDTLPTVPTLEYELYGFANIGLNWTFENKMYYQYELYASKTKDFTPNTFDLIHQGQTSSFLFQARPNETWYFKVCGINSHGRRTGFSNQVTVTTKKIDDMSNYFEEAAIGNAVVGSLTADYMTAGIIKGNWIDAKNLTVTNGNGKRTLDIDSFGNVNLDVTSLNIQSKDVALKENTVENNKIITSINATKENIKIQAEKIDLTGNLDLQGRFKCWKSNSDKTGNYLNLEGAMLFGYNKTGGSYPTFASGLWTDENLGYISVGYTRADISDENGCLYISPQTGNQGGRLTFSRLVGSTVKASNLLFQKDGSINFVSNLKGQNEVDDVYTYTFDAGVSARSFMCDNLRCKSILPLYTGTYDLGNVSRTFKDVYAHSLGTTNSQLELGTLTSAGKWEQYGALGVNSSLGYLFPVKSSGAFSLGTSNNRFSALYVINPVSVGSDKRNKTDIHYLDEKNNVLTVIEEEPQRVSKNMNITTNDMYNFIKDDLRLASYRYKVNLEKGITDVDYGFIAQDILYTKVGSEIVQLEDKNNLESNLSYNQGNYISVIAGALQEEIRKRDEQISNLEKRLDKLEVLLKNSNLIL